MAHHWYFVRCQSGQEDSICRQVQTRVKMAGLQDLVPQVLVPFERVTDMKGGKTRVVNKKLYPGYLMLQADIEDLGDPRSKQAQSVVRDTPKVGDFLGGHGEPVPLSDGEVQSILVRMSDSDTALQVNIGLSKGDMVKIKSGPFDGFDGTIEEVLPDKGMVTVIVTIFGRPTPVSLKYWEVEPV
ncbi:MAG: transcription termination/antitermination factor NusG [Planctomycetes bacterium]|nr:transcription termination/antitermination factor NusG [Planctomycetota bacterium]